MNDLEQTTQDLIKELEAFDPNFRDNYKTLELAAAAASAEAPYVMGMYKTVEHIHAATVDAPDVQGYFDLCAKLDADSALPYGTANYGKAFGETVFESEGIESNLF